MSKDYRIFISHAWKYDDDYYRLENLLKKDPYFSFYNHSVPNHDPLIANNDYELTQLLFNQIRGTHVVLIIAGMYVNYSKWIQKEIDIAIYYNKPIIGIKPWGRQYTPIQVQEDADEMVSWNTSSIIDAIERMAL